MRLVRVRWRGRSRPAGPSGPAGRRTRRAGSPRASGSRRLDGGEVDEDVRRPAVGGDEAVALLAVEPLHGALCHWCFSFGGVGAVRRPTLCRPPGCRGVRRPTPERRPLAGDDGEALAENARRMVHRGRLNVRELQLATRRDASTFRLVLPTAVPPRVCRGATVRFVVLREPAPRRRAVGPPVAWRRPAVRTYARPARRPGRRTIGADRRGCAGERRRDAAGRDRAIGATGRRLPPAGWTEEDARLGEWFAAACAERGLTVSTDRCGNQWAWWGDPDADLAAADHDGDGGRRARRGPARCRAPTACRARRRCRAPTAEGRARRRRRARRRGRARRRCRARRRGPAGATPQDAQARQDATISDAPSGRRPPSRRSATAASSPAATSTPCPAAAPRRAARRRRPPSRPSTCSASRASSRAGPSASSASSTRRARGSASPAPAAGC